MSVYRLNYRAYTGPVTPLWMRILVIARYGFNEAWSSKITVGLFILSLLPPVVFLVFIYLANNPMARALIGAGSPDLAINARFFLVVLQIQSWLALVLASWVAPRLMGFDLADNALPILLSHPISRFGYVLGKFVALFGSLSVVTWVPAMILFVDQSYSSQVPWAAGNLRIALGMMAGTLIWIAFVSVLCLAVSAWVKWRVLATSAIFAAVFIPSGVGAIVSAVLRTKWGFLLNVPYMMSLLWQRLLGSPELFGRWGTLPTSSILMMLTLVCCVSVGMLNKRVRAREVVRG
jgi:ABC-type transport system involved in multi-copper enzyme maturation permease subunit